MTNLETEKDEDVDEAWAKEIEKRSLELSEGTVHTIAWEEVREIAHKNIVNYECQKS